MYKSHTTLIRVLLLGLVLVVGFSFGAAAQKMVTQLVAADGKALMVTAFDENPTVAYEAFDMDLRVFTPKFTGEIRVPGKSSAILVVSGDRVTDVITMQGSALPKAPAIPGDGYLVVGSGVGEVFLKNFFNVGDVVQLREKPSVTPDPRPTKIYTFTGGEYEITDWNRGRGAMEMIVYTPDYGTHTFTNEWGVEAAVVDGKVVAMKGYQDPSLFEIPENGYVLSGHNVANLFLVQYVDIGVLVELE